MKVLFYHLNIYIIKQKRKLKDKHDRYNCFKYSLQNNAKILTGDKHFKNLDNAIIL